MKLVTTVVYVASVNNDYAQFYEETVNKNEFELVTANDVLWELLFLRTKPVNLLSCSVLLVIAIM